MAVTITGGAHRFSRRKVFYYVFVFLCVATVGVSFLLWNQELAAFGDHTGRGHPVGTLKHDEENGCGPPALEVFHRAARDHYYKMSVDCDKASIWSAEVSGVAFSIQRGHHLVMQENPGLSCCYRAFFRKDDMTNSYAEVCQNITSASTEIPAGIDFIQVLCHNSKGGIAYQDAFPLAHPQKVTNLLSPPTSRSPRLNVLVIGLDATSRLNFIRQMPQSSDYLLRQLGAVPLMEYSAQGIGTVKNLFPLLTGQSLGEVSSGCRNGSHLDTCPFIWKDFAAMGYVTAFSDDWFNLGKGHGKAFEKTPTHFYYRPLVVHRKNFLSSSTLCFGRRLSRQVLLEFVGSVREASRSLRKPYFHFTWSDSLSHDYFNGLGPGDLPLLQFLCHFKESTGWNDTVLLLVGDHGHSVTTDFYLTPEGQVEYTLPLAYVVLPPWFHKKYPVQFANLKDNARHKLVTSYDLHETLKDILQLGIEKTQKESEKGISLFENIGHRKCMEAGISLNLCRRCFPTIPVKGDDPLLKAATNSLLSYINEKVKQHKMECATQTIKSDSSQKGFKWDRRDVSRELCNVSGHTDLDVDFSDSQLQQLRITCNVATEMVDLVDVQFTTDPYGAQYKGQVLIKRNRNDGQLLETFLTEEIQRVDWYQFTGYCVSDNKPYCICKEERKDFRTFGIKWSLLDIINLLSKYTLSQYNII